MNLFALSSTQQAGGHIALAAVLGVAGFFLLLPRPRGRFAAAGIGTLIIAAAVFGTWLVTAFGKPMPDVIGTALFALFAAGALGFGTVLVVQRNPARGAIAFAFVVLSTCGLFLLLAAPFLMAATIIIYAGAIVVTFMFVLMLSQADGPSDENDRSREPLYGAFAGFAFVGLVLFTLYQTSQNGNASEDGNAARHPQRLLTPVVTAEERQALGDVATRLAALEKRIGDGGERLAPVEELEQLYDDLVRVTGVSPRDQMTTIKQTDDSIRARLEQFPGPPGGATLYREDQQAREVLRRVARVREAGFDARAAVRREGYKTEEPDHEAARASVRRLREEVLLLRGATDLPASNVRGLGFVLYSDHLLAIELAGALLLVAVIGAIAVSQRKGVAQ